MPYPAIVQAAIDRCARFYSGAVQTPAVPGGMDGDGHAENFVPALRDVATIGQAVADVAASFGGDADAAAASARSASDSAAAASASADRAATWDPTGYAQLASPAFTGNPTAPTQAAGNNSTRLATTAFVARDALLKAGGTLTGPLALTPGAVEVLTGGTKAVSFNTGNRRQFELRSGSNVFNVTDIPQSGGDLELDLLYTDGSLGFTQTVNWSIGGGAKSTAIGDTGLTLTAGQRYAVVFWNMGGTIYGAIG